MSYASRDWKAQETTDMVGSKHTLTVIGEVDVGRPNDTPELAEATPQGINPTILLLELSVREDPNPGSEVITPKKVTFSREISSRQYRQVTISGETDMQTVDVEQVLS